MSDYEVKPGQFTLWKNDYKKDDKHPDYKGTGKDLNGEDIQVAAWLRETSGGKKFFSCRFDLDTKKMESKPAEPIEQESDDLPF